MCEPVRQRVVVTGASGLLGRALVDALLSTHTIYALSHARSLDGKFPLSVVTKQLDLTDKDAVRKELLDINPHVILHAAAICRTESINIDRARAEAVNVMATETIAAVASELPSSWLIFFSSAEVLITHFSFSTSDGVCKPNSPGHPTTVFGEMKLKAEQAVHNKLTSAGILRLSKVYGTGDCRVTEVVRQLMQAKGAPITFDNETVFSPIWAPDIAYICQQLLERKQKHCGFGGIWHWSGQERLTDLAIAQQAAPLLGIDVSTIKAQREHPSLQPLHAELDVGMLKVMGVVRTTPFAEALQVIVEHLKADSQH